MTKQQPEANKVYTRSDVEEFLAEISGQVVENETPSLHTTIALDTLMRIPNARELFDEELKQQARDLWFKVKSSGVRLDDPPLLFGMNTNLLDGEGVDPGGESSEAPADE